MGEPGRLLPFMQSAERESVARGGGHETHAGAAGI